MWGEGEGLWRAPLVLSVPRNTPGRRAEGALVARQGGRVAWVLLEVEGRPYRFAAEGFELDGDPATR
jgi:hypothetical protein